MILGGRLPGKVSGCWNLIILDSSAVEHPAVNRRVVGSNPTRGVILRNGKEKKEIEIHWLWPGGQAVKTRPFHGWNRGSIPRRVILQIFGDDAFMGHTRSHSEHDG